MTARSLENGVSLIQMFLVRSNAPSLAEIFEQKQQGSSGNFAANGCRGKGRIVRFAAESRGFGWGDTTSARIFAANSVQMQQTGTRRPTDGCGTSPERRHAALADP